MTQREQIPKTMMIDGKEYRKFKSFRKKIDYEGEAKRYRGLGYSVRLYQRGGKGRRYMFIRDK